MPAGERIDELIQNTVPQMHYVGYLRGWDTKTSTALVSLSAGGTSSIEIKVAESLAFMVNANIPFFVFIPNARVLIKKVGSNPPVVTDILDVPVVGRKGTFAKK